MKNPTIVIHGGAGRALSDKTREKFVREALSSIIERLWQGLSAGAGAMEIARQGCIALEDCEHFNAGLGSAIQSDGQVRMSASIMDGTRQSFSGIINVERVQNPTVMAVHLQQARDRVLDGVGAVRLAREMRLPLFDAVVPRRLEEWIRQGRKERSDDQAQVSAPSSTEVGPDDRGSGTVGVVVRDFTGALAASTSTGGRGFERVGRVSDSATVAGNYATEYGAVSCTGIGEDITDEALAARIIVRVQDGMTLDEAVGASIEEARQRERRLAAIAVDHRGQMSWGKTTELLLAVGRTGDEERWAF